MTYGMKGVLVGALVGGLAAWSQWQGEAGSAVRIVIVSAAIGFGAGYLIGKRRTA